MGMGGTDRRHSGQVRILWLLQQFGLAQALCRWRCAALLRHREFRGAGPSSDGSPTARRLATPVHSGGPLWAAVPARLSTANPRALATCGRHTSASPAWTAWQPMPVWSLIRPGPSMHPPPSAGGEGLARLGTTLHGHLELELELELGRKEHNGTPSCARRPRRCASFPSNNGTYHRQSTAARCASSSQSQPLPALMPRLKPDTR